MPTKDIQKELFDLVKDMTVQNIYSQLTYFLIDFVTRKENPFDPAYELAKIIGLLSDSYCGKIALGKVPTHKEGF